VRRRLLAPTPWLLIPTPDGTGNLDRQRAGVNTSYMSDPYSLARHEMIVQQLEAHGVRSPRVLAAMARVPREKFVLEEFAGLSYSDRALPISCEQTISQPYMVALMTELLDLQGSEKVLEVGTGSGYQAAVLSLLAAEVVSIERFAELSQQAGRVLAELRCSNVKLVVGDGSLGWPAEAPYDAIIVTAAAETCPPALHDQLADPGRLVIPVGPANRQVLELHRKIGGEISVEQFCGCRFVPLVGKGGAES
jgi:protein-L-isoaspartate(D-aspartate) O-methyltransferase